MQVGNFLYCEYVAVIDLAATTSIHAKVNSFTTIVFVPSVKMVNNILVLFLNFQSPKEFQEPSEIHEPPFKNQWCVVTIKYYSLQKLIQKKLY